MTTNPVESPRVPTWTVQDGLRKARESAGLEQGQLADLMDVSRGTVSHYENGTRKPRRPNVIAWAFACNVEPDWLLSLPHLDLNQEPFGYGSPLVSDLTCPLCGWEVNYDGHAPGCDYHRVPRAVVVDLAAYRLDRAS